MANTFTLWVILLLCLYLPRSACHQTRWDPTIPNRMLVVRPVRGPIARPWSIQHWPGL